MTGLSFRSLKLTHKMLNQLGKASYAHKKTGLDRLFSLASEWRFNSVIRTMDVLTNAKKLQKLQTQSLVNLERWQQEPSQVKSPQCVEVVPSDWGIITHQLTKTYGRIYPVLNFANDHIPGGDVFDRGNAQEENLWARTSCPLSLFQPGIYFDEQEREFYYEHWMSKVIAAQERMPRGDLRVLNERLNMVMSERRKVYFNPDLQVAFRGPEILVEVDFPDPKLYADSNMSFEFLSKRDIFPFYELRSSAPLLQQAQYAWGDAADMYEKELRRRISAQLDTLVLHGFTHAILGAWGCGCFKNDATVVAKVYREEIEKRKSWFTHLMFPVLNKVAREGSNFGAFKAELDGIRLEGKQVELPSSPGASRLLKP